MVVSGDWTWRVGKSKKTRQARRRASKRAALARKREAEAAEPIIDLRDGDTAPDMSSREREAVDERQLHDAHEVREGLLGETSKTAIGNIAPVTTSEADEISAQLWEGDDVRVVDMSDRHPAAPRPTPKRRSHRRGRRWLRRRLRRRS